ncbi:MAG: hypothetical protein HFH68_14530 [Lachnospiraceae bacterium]|nr:hypothetical protein [Lachnospiraceae bacterium]
MEKITEKRLLEAGWTRKRKIDISSFKEKYLKAGIIMPENVQEFLSVYGLLVFDSNDRKEDLEFIPDKAIGYNLDKSYFEDMLEEYGINGMMYPVGITCRDNLTVLMTNENTFYCYTNGYLEKAGYNVETMLDCLVGECYEAEEIE